MRACAFFSKVLITVAIAICTISLLSAMSALEPAGTGGVEVVDRAFASLSVHRRLLVVGAHPDDEDTTLLTLVRRGLGGEAAYLSLSRGEGGQNLIGPELGVGLGLIRTGELNAARGLEGTSQFFTRAFDFGYTRSLEETLQRWPRERLLEDAVRVVRRFKPQVVVAVFPSDSRAGHGQHQASGVIASDLMEFAGSPDRYPDLTAEGYPPWQPEAFFRSVWWDPELTTVHFALDAIDPFLGKSVYQIAASSRSMHRSQDMGTLQRIGRIEGGIGWESGSAGEGETELFGGIDTDLSAIASCLAPGLLREQTDKTLWEIEQSADRARNLVNPANLDDSFPALAGLMGQLNRLLSGVVEAEGQNQGARIVSGLLKEKLRLAMEGVAAAAGVSVDAVSDRATVSPGGNLEATATLWNSGSRRVDILTTEILATSDWRVVDTQVPEKHPRISGLESLNFDLALDRQSRPSVPYFLRRPLEGDMYDWNGVESAIQGTPLEPAPLTLLFKLEVDGVAIDLEREVVYRSLDQAVGEIREPVRVVPILEVQINPGLVLWPIERSGSRQLEISLRSNSDRPLRGRLRFDLDPQWPEVASQDFAIEKPGGTKVLNVNVTLPAMVEPGRRTISVVAELENGEEFEFSYPLIRYPHIRPLPLKRRAESEIQVLDLELPDLHRIGYIRGASDRVPEVLSEIGIDVELLSAETLESGNFSGFDAIVVGIRAY
jgi:LmbE family N-acetylglucosaminyl deacetylase